MTFVSQLVEQIIIENIKSIYKLNLFVICYDPELLSLFISLLSSHNNII